MVQAFLRLTERDEWHRRLIQYCLLATVLRTAYGKLSPRIRLFFLHKEARQPHWFVQCEISARAVKDALLGNASIPHSSNFYDRFITHLRR